ncbi:hypothetical protein RHMOL_Rhmol06G0040900 [Rhododendron molle]|uniref:Uncharacterized protein n=1 Tax=Rhododendron molle TaxID=49168 RepID=A0ACC0N990_RHOML|nr:hypothetical protein RHMOL_Rhmol06G0040900 [Rhododendron molle]
MFSLEATQYACNQTSIIRPIWLVNSYFFCLLVLPIAVFNEEHDIGTYTIKAVDDPRTLNKILYIKPPMNIYSFNELVSLWEKKIGKTLERIYVAEDQILKRIEGQ